MKISTDLTERTLKYAAEELSFYIEKITGEKYGISDGNDGDITFVLNESYVDNPVIDDRFIVNIKDGRGTVSGSNKRSILLGVYAFLKEIGCRFVRPGENGEVIPRKKLQELSASFDMSGFYPYRIECIEGSVCEEFVVETIKWLPKAGYNAFFIQGAVPYNFFYRWYNHEENPFRGPEDVSYEHAESVTAAIEDAVLLCGLQFHDVGHAYTFEPWGMRYLTSWAHTYEFSDDVRPFVALVNGKRDVCHNSINFTNLCYSNKEGRALIAKWFVEYMKKKPYVDFLHIYLADNINNHCECPECMKSSISDLYVEMLNEIDEAFTKNNINCKIVSAQYTDTRNAPIKTTFKNPERFLLMPAVSRTYDPLQYEGKYEGNVPKEERNHFVDMPGFKKNMAFFDEWKEKFKNPYFFFEYHMYGLHYFDPGYMWISENLAEDIKKLREYGSFGMLCCKTQRCYMPTSLPAYTAGAMLFNPDRSFEEVKEEYFEAAFGKNADIAREYLEKLSEYFNEELLREYVDVYAGGDSAEKSRMPKWFKNSEAAEKFSKALEYIEKFKAEADGYINAAEDGCRARSFELLKMHTEIAKGFGKALLEGAKGNKATLKEKFDELALYVMKNEEDYALEFDGCLYVKRIRQFFSNVLN